MKLINIKDTSIIEIKISKINYEDLYFTHKKECYVQLLN